MEMQQTLVDARIAELRECASDVHRHDLNHKRTTRLTRMRIALGLWFVNMGLSLVHDGTPVMPAYRR